MSRQTRYLDYKSYFNIPNSEDELQVYEMDLVTLGFDQHKVKRFLGGNRAMARELLEPPPEQARKGRYKELRLHNGRDDYEATNWVVFDPFIPLLYQALDRVRQQDLPIIIKLAFYKPGNDRYLEHNIRSNAIRIRSVGDLLKKKCIKYTPNGPIVTMMDDEPEGANRSTELIIKEE